MVGYRHWTAEPRIGEASNPGPHAFFDVESDDAWSNFESEPDYEVDLPPAEHDIQTCTEGGARPGSNAEPPPC